MKTTQYSVGFCTLVCPSSWLRAHGLYAQDSILLKYAYRLAISPCSHSPASSSAVYSDSPSYASGSSLPQIYIPRLFPYISAVRIDDFIFPHDKIFALEFRINHPQCFRRSWGGIPVKGASQTVAQQHRSGRQGSQPWQSQSKDNICYIPHKSITTRRHANLHFVATLRPLKNTPPLKFSASFLYTGAAAAQLPSPPRP